MDISNIIAVTSTCITTFVIVFLTIRERTIIKSIKVYHELFDIEKVKEFSKLRDSIAQLKYRELVLKKFEPIKEKLIPELEVKFKEIYEEKSKKVLEDYFETLDFIAFLWMDATFNSEMHESKDEFFKEFLPRNYEIIKGLVQDKEQNIS